MPCMHCENAPCEVVCPVAATVHDTEGLNVMVYNRCVGTRFCSNNCPYKVRRFNFFDYADDDHRAVEVLRNPDVTVRGARRHGEMHLLRPAHQRSARIEADRESRPIARRRDRHRLPAGLPDAGDRLRRPQRSRQRASPAQGAAARTTALLDELNTRPRTTYLARVRNPNPLSDRRTHERMAQTRRRPDDRQAPCSSRA